MKNPKTNPEVLYSRLRPDEFDKRLKEYPVCYIPLGALEWHYHHLPLGTDGIEAEGICVETAKRHGGIVFPAVWPSIRGQYRKNGKKFYRNIKVEYDLFKGLLDSIIQNCREIGFKIVILFPGHGGGAAWYEDIAYEWYARKRYMVFCPGMFRFHLDNGKANFSHASFLETAMVAHLAPETVALGELDRISGPYTQRDIKKSYAKSPERHNRLLRENYIGGVDPRLGAGKKHGKELVEMIIPRLAQYVADKHQKMKSGLRPGFDLPFTSKKCWQTCAAYKNNFVQLDGAFQPACILCSEASKGLFRKLISDWGREKAKEVFSSMLKLADREPKFTKERRRYLKKIVKEL